MRQSSISSAKKAISDPRYSQAIRYALQSWNGPEFVYDEDGRKIRVWGDRFEDPTTYDDVRDWLRGQRVVEDLRDGLEFVRDTFIQRMVKEDQLRKINGMWWITKKAADKYGLEPVMGCAFPE